MNTAEIAAKEIARREGNKVLVRMGLPKRDAESPEMKGLLHAQLAAIAGSELYPVARWVEEALAAAPTPAKKAPAKKAPAKKAPAKKAPAKKGPNPHTLAANASGHASGSAEWWGVYKAHSAAARRRLAAAEAEAARRAAKAAEAAAK